MLPESGVTTTPAAAVIDAKAPIPDCVAVDASAKTAGVGSKPGPVTVPVVPMANVLFGPAPPVRGALGVNVKPPAVQMVGGVAPITNGDVMDTGSPGESVVVKPPRAFPTDGATIVTWVASDVFALSRSDPPVKVIIPLTGTALAKAIDITAASARAAFFIVIICCFFSFCVV